MVVLALSLAASACSKSVEGETQRWSTGTSRVAELSAQYPGFRGAIEARKAAAQKIHEAAAGLEGDAKIEKLAEANKALMGGFVDDLDDLDDKMKRLRESRVEAASKASDASSRLGASVAAEDAQRALERAEAALRAGAADEAGAAAVLKKVMGDLDTAQEAVDKVVAADRSKKADADAAKRADEAKTADAAAADAAAKAPWKCGYCESENPHDETSCKSCGAPRKSDEAKGDPAGK